MYLCHVNNVHFIEENVYIHYVNDLRKEWDKYPINYIESVVGLRKIQEKTVFTWNTDNKIVFDKLNQGYISNTIKAIELSLSHRFKMKHYERVEYIKNVVEYSQILSIEVPRCLGKYQNILLNKLRKKKYIQVLFIIHLKVFVEKRGGLFLIKKF
jgi:hypothetical protein